MLEFKELVKDMTIDEARDYVNKHKRYKLPNLEEGKLIGENNVLLDCGHILIKNGINYYRHSFSKLFKTKIRLINALPKVDVGTVFIVNLEDINFELGIGVYTPKDIKSGVIDLKNSSVFRLFDAMDANDLLRIK